MPTLTDTVWTLPDNMRGVTESRFYLSSEAIDNPSPWTNERPRMEPFLDVWMADLTFPPRPELGVHNAAGVIAREGWRVAQGWVTRLKGTSGLLRVADSFRLQPAYNLRVAATQSQWSNNANWSNGSQWTQGALPPFVTLDESASAEADSVVLRGLPVSTEDVLSPGDVMEFRPNGIMQNWGMFHEVVHCARSNSSGKARVYFRPGLRMNLLAGDPAVFKEPTCVFRLADKAQGIMSRTVDRLGRHGMSLIEHTRDA